MHSVIVRSTRSSAELSTEFPIWSHTYACRAELEAGSICMRVSPVSVWRFARAEHVALAHRTVRESSEAICRGFAHLLPRPAVRRVYRFLAARE